MSTSRLSNDIIPTNSTFSPVTLAESPAASSQKNLTGLPRIARDCAADIYNNIQQWNSLHIRGAAVIKEIALFKSNSNQMYPEGLEPLAETLYEAINEQKLIINNLKTCAQQLKSLINLHKSPTPLFISWSVEKMASVGESIYQEYRKEYQLKQFIADNVCHIQGKDKLMFYAASWAYLPYITSDIKLTLESLLTETGHRNKT